MQRFLDPLTQHQVEDFHHRMTEKARFNRNLTMFLGVAQMRRLKLEQPESKPPVIRRNLLFLSIVVSKFFLRLILKTINFVLRRNVDNPRKKVGSAAENAPVIIDVFPEGQRTFDGTTIYQPYKSGRGFRES